jgi:hypothetical protein
VPPTSAGPCPQAARSTGQALLVPNAEYFAVETAPIVPRSPPPPPGKPILQVTPSINWPYHALGFNGIDCLWWALLFRAMYWSDGTWLNNVANWAQTIVRQVFFKPTNPNLQPYGLVELQDCVLIAIPGTQNETEALQYVMAHSLESLATDPAAGWTINSAWFLRATPILAAYLSWPPPNPLKPILIIGHSSGGAYGAYVAAKLAQISGILKYISLLTYGAPIWGTPSLNAAMLATVGQIVEFQNPNDPITVIPPTWSLINSFNLGYALNPQPIYQRNWNVLLLGNQGPPTPSSGNQPQNAIISAFQQVLTTQNYDASHSRVAYSVNANAWMQNDPNLVAWGFQDQINSLEAVYEAMVTAGA